MTVTNLPTPLYRIWRMPWQQKVLWFVALSMVTTWILQLLTPTQVEPQPTVLTNAGNLNSKVQNIDYSGEPPAIPEKLPTATAVSYQDIESQLTETIINKYGFSEVEDVENTWKNDTSVLFKTSDPTVITLATTVEDEEELEDPDKTFTQAQLNEVMDVARQTVAELYPENPPVLLEDKIGYIADAHEPGFAASLEEARLVLVPFAYKIGDFPVYLSQDTGFMVSFMFDVDGKFVKAEFRPYILKISTVRSYESLSIRDAMSNLNQNNSALLFTDYFEPDTKGLGNVTSGEMKDADIEYRFEPATGTIQPYYHFYGIVKNSEGVVIRTEFLTPAIQTDFDN